MSKLKKTTYELRDVAVVQAPVSFCDHRKDVNPFINVCNREVYPIFVAPMASVTDENNYKTWIDNKITPVIPRSVQQRLSLNKRMELAKETFVSLSLNEAEQIFNFSNLINSSHGIYICIDIAHGTLNRLYKICKKIKEQYGSKVTIMTGNIANPLAYSFYANAGVDYVRCGIGGGSRCTSSANVSIHYGMATLLDDLNEERKAYAHSHNGIAPTKLIADGGIGWFDDIQKAIALGADGVMIGKLFAECEEACGPIVYAESEEDYNNGVYYLNLEDGLIEKLNLKPYRNYYGMSTKMAQRMTGGDGDKTSEGISRLVEVKYPVSKWIDNMQSYLRSCMTYTNSNTINEIQNNSQVVILGGSGDAAYRK